MPENDTLTRDGEWLSISQVAAITGFNKEYVRQMIRVGHLKAFKNGTGEKAHWRIQRSVLEKMAFENSSERLIRKRARQLERLIHKARMLEKTG